MAESTLSSYFDTDNIFKLLIDGVETVIEEPTNYTDDTFQLKRDIKEHGVNWEFSSSEVVLQFPDECGRQELLTKYETSGINSQIFLIIGADDGGGFVEHTRMQLVMTFFKEMRYYVECTLKRVRFEDKFRARQGIEVDITRSTDMEGNAITPLTATDVILHSKTIKRNLRIDHTTGSTPFRLNISGAFLPTSSGGTQLWSSGFVNFGRSNVVANEFDTALQSRSTNVFGGNDNALIRGEIPGNDTQEWLRPFFVCEEAGTYTISYDIDVTNSLCKFPQKRPPNYADTPLYLQRILKFAVEIVRAETIATKNLNGTGYTNTDYEVLYEDYVLKNDLEDNTLISWGSLSTVVDDGRTNVYLLPATTLVSRMEETKVTLEVGDAINLHMFYDFDEIQPPDFEEQRMVITDDSYFEISSSSFFKVVADTVYPSTVCKMYKVSDVFKQLALIYTGTTNSLTTTFFTSGQGSRLYTTSGKLMRGFTSTEQPPIFSHKKLFDSVNAIFCCGIGFEKDGSENDIVRIEEMEYFYQDAEILDLSTVSNDYSSEVYEQVVYNEIEVGYAKITSGDVESGIGLDDFHTNKVWNTPIKSFDNRLSLVSPYLCSGIAIELTRREQKNINETKDWKYDDDNFLVFTSENEVFTNQYVGIRNVDTNVQRRNIIVLLYPIHSAFLGATQITISNTGNGELDDTHDILSFEVFLEFDIIYLYLDTDFSSVISYQNATITYGNDIIAERTSSFKNVTGITEPSTAYNLRSQPLRMMQNWGKLINSGLYYESKIDYLRYVGGKGNTTLVTKLNDGDTYNRGDLSFITLTENQDLQLSDNQGFTRLFYPELAEFKLKLDYNQLYYLKRAFEGRSGDSNNNGYITVKDYKNRDVQIWVLTIEYNALDKICMVTGLIKKKGAIPTPENPNPTLDKGTFSSAFSSAFDIDLN